jgi:hypothetical protein
VAQCINILVINGTNGIATRVLKEIGSIPKKHSVDSLQRTAYLESNRI